MNVAEHYDLLIEEGNDPFRDPPCLQRYMDQWDGPVFIERMQLHPSRTVLEIGVGTGRIAISFWQYRYPDGNGGDLQGTGCSCYESADPGCSETKVGRNACSREGRMEEKTVAGKTR